MQDSLLLFRQNINISLHPYCISLPWTRKLKLNNINKCIYFLIRPLISVIILILFSIFHCFLYALWVSVPVPEYSHLKFMAIHLMLCHISRFIAILSGDAWTLYNETQGYWLQNRMMKRGLDCLSRKLCRKIWVM